MTELVELRLRNAHLVQRLADAELALAAFARGEVDAVAVEAAATPVLLHAAQQQLRTSQHLLRAVFDGSLDAIMLADDTGVYVDCNPAACALFLLPREQVIGRAFSELVGTEGDRHTLQRPDGSRRVVELSAVPHVTPGVHLSVLRDVTARVSAEESLRHSEALFRAVIEKSAEVVSLTAADGTTRYLTPAAWSHLGWKPEEVGGRTMREQVLPEDRARLEIALASLIETGARDMSMDLRVLHRDGSIRWFESTATNLLDDPNVNAIVGNYRDITAHKTAEAALRASWDQLAEAQAIAHVGSWEAGVELTSSLTWSAECDRIYGLPIGTPMSVMDAYSRMHPDDRDRIVQTIGAAIESGDSAHVEHRIVRPDGVVRRVQQRVVVERDASGVAVSLTGTLQDITEQHDAVELMRESEQRYRRIVENTTEGVWMYNAEGVTTFMNTRMAEMLGWTVAETVGQPMLTFMQEIIAPGKREITAQRPRGAVERSDHHLRRKDGSALWASIQVTPLYDGEGNYEAALCLVSDVSAERTADATRAHLAAIVESSEDSIISASLDGVITSWNGGAERLYQYTASEMVGRSMTVLIPSELHAKEREIQTCVARGERFPQYEATRLRKDGSLVDVAITFSSIRGTDGRSIGISKIARDLTARREAEAAHHRIEEQFRQVQKMEAVGRLAGGVAHDFNNVLTVILSYAEFALEDLKQGDPLRDDMLQVKNAGIRAAELTRQLLAFSRQQVLQPRVVALDEVLEGMKVMLQRLLGEDVTLSIVTPAELGHVLADPGQIEQVVMNLAVNARDAMPDGGVLSIQTSDLHLDVGYLSGFAEIPPGDYVVLSVSDTGTGMDATTRLRIFEPFFTTKAPGKGTGLGLSTVFGIVQQSGGYLEVSSEVGHGTSFKVYFPRTEGAPEVKHSSGTINVVRGTETILLVEDEDQVRTVGSTILRRHGYNVIEAANGGEAILISQDFAGTIDLLLTDVVMPRMNGRKLREHLQPQRPGMKVLFTSGYTDDAIVHHGVLAAGVAFLQKPFTTNSLLQKVREVLG